MNKRVSHNAITVCTKETFKLNNFSGKAVISCIWIYSSFNSDNIASNYLIWRIDAKHEKLEQAFLESDHEVRTHRKVCFRGDRSRKGTSVQAEIQRTTIRLSGNNKILQKIYIKL